MSEPRTDTVAALLSLWADTDGIRDLHQGEGFDPDNLEMDGIYLARVSGADDYELIMSGTDSTFNDNFSVEFVLLAFEPGQSAIEAMRRWEAYSLAMRRAVAGDVGLGGIVNDALEVLSAETDGPELVGGPEGWGCVGSMTFQVVATIGAWT